MPHRLANDQYFVLGTMTIGPPNNRVRRMRGRALFGTDTTPRFHTTEDICLLHCRGAGSGLIVSGPHTDAETEAMIENDPAGWPDGEPA